MNDYSKYMADYNEALQEDREGLFKFINEEREKALKSYPENTEVVCCSICGEPLVYSSVSYYEGFHIDNCV